MDTQTFGVEKHQSFTLDTRVTAFRTPKYQNLSMASHVKRLLRLRRGIGCSVDEVAEHFYISPRTFTRRLAAEGVNFRTLHDEVKMELAETYLSDRALGVAEVASYLGYRNASNFIKAFKRWTGLTPSRYRGKLS